MIWNKKGQYTYIVYCLCFKVASVQKADFKPYQRTSITTVMEYQNQEKKGLKVTAMLKIFSLVFGIEECGHGKTHKNFASIELGKLLLIRFNFLEMCPIFFHFPSQKYQISL